MTYQSSAAFYRLGYSVTWNVVNSPLYFSRSVRLNIVLNTFLKGMLKYFRIKLVKWIGNMEGNYFKLSLVVFDKAYPKYYKFRGRVKLMKFSNWNYLYFKKTSQVLTQLKDYYTKRHFRPRFKLGSGIYWHKFFKSVFFILNKKFRHTRKSFKNGTIDAEFLCEEQPEEEEEEIEEEVEKVSKKKKPKKKQPKKKQLTKAQLKLLKLRSRLGKAKGPTKKKRIIEALQIKSRSENSEILKFNNIASFNLNKFSKFPHYQFMFKHYLKLHLYLRNLNFNYNLSFLTKKFKFFFLLELISFNYFFKKSIFLTKNKPLLRFHSRFVNSNLVRYTLTKKIISHKLYYFNYLNYVKGSNYQWLGSGRVVKSYKSFIKKPFYNLNSIPWSLAFLRGYFFNMSYKKVVRRKILGVSKLRTFLDKIKVSNYIIKNYIVWKKYQMNNKNNKMLKKNLFFNNNFIVEAHERFVKNFFFKKIDHKNKNKLRNLIMKRLLKNKINSSISVDSLLSSQYFSHDKEISPDRDIQRFQSLSNRFYYLRKKFRKGVFNGVLLTKNYFGITTKKIKIKLFKIFCYRLTLLNKNISSTTSSKKSFLNDFVLKSDTIKFFNLKNLTNNPFSNFSNNFLFFFNHPRYLLFIPPKKKIIINLNNYLVPKTLFDDNFLKATNSINRLIKLSAFLKIYTQLITFNIFLKKKICVYRNELSIFLFRSFWSLEFYKIYFNFKFRRLNFEKLFKKNKNNIYSKTYIKSFSTRNNRLKKMLFCKDQEAKKNISYKNIYQAVFKYDKNIIFNYKKINKINKTTFEDYFFNYCCDLRLKTLANKKKISSFRLLDNKQHSIKFKHLKFKKKFFRYKINFFLKKKHKLLSLNLSNFYLFRNSYVRVWKKQVQTYYLKKNMKLWFHRKFRHNYQLLIKNISSVRFFNRISLNNINLLLKATFIDETLQKLISVKRRIIIKFFLYKNIVIFNFILFFFKSFFKLPIFLIKKLLLFGFFAFRKNFSFLAVLKLLNQFFKKHFSSNNLLLPYHSKIGYISTKIRKRVLKNVYINNKFLQRKTWASEKRAIYRNSLQRYAKVQITNNNLVRGLLKQEFDNLKDYKHHKLSYYYKLKLFNIEKKKKKNFKLRSRNKFFGRVNYRKYKLHQRKEMLQETIKKQKLINFGKKNKRLYMYFRVQKNSSKGVLFNQYKTVSKSLYDIGSYFKQVNAGLNLSTEDQARSLYILSNYNKFNVFMLKKKIHYNFNFLNKYEFQTFFSYLDGFKKNRLSNAFWKISKSFYFSKFYLSRIKANFYETLFYKRSTQEFKRKVVVHFPLNGNLKSTFNQYNYRYLKHLERTISITNKIYRKFRNNWTKDFFSYRDHLKIFSLIQKKLYYNIKLNQKVDLKMLKIKLTDNLKIKKQKIINNVVLNKHKKLSVNKWQLIVLKYYNQLQINLKDFIFLNNKNKKLRYFLKFFLKYNFNYNSLDITKHFFLQDVSKYKMVSSSIFFSNSNLYKNVEYNPILKNQILIRFYNSWLKLFLWNFNFFKKNIFSDYISSSDNFQNFNTQASLVHKVIENKNKDKFYFGKFLKYFNEKTDETSLFQVYNLKDLIDPKFTIKSIQFFQNFFFFFLTNTKNTKNLLIISSAIKNIFKMRILSFIEKYDCKNSLVFNNNFFYKPISMKLLYFPIFVYFVINFLIFKIYRIKNNYFFRKKNYTVIPMIRNKKFLFWLEQQFEKHFKMNFKLNYISATKAISKFYRNGTNFYFSYAKKIFFYRFFQGWRQQSIYADIMWIILIAIKYYSSSFLSNMLAEQIVKRKKQWPFIKIVKAIIRDILPKSMVDNPIKIDGLRIGINGKINGRDRSINYLMWKYFKDRQISKIHPIYLKVDYSLSTANSKYGIFGLRVWISRF